MIPSDHLKLGVKLEGERWKSEGACSVETSRSKTLSRNVVLVESVSTPYDIISGATSGVQT